MDTVLNQIGNTPLVKLKQASELTGCHIYGKAEYFNPGESVKDRAALFIVQDALKRKLISKGGTIVEGTVPRTPPGAVVETRESSGAPGNSPSPTRGRPRPLPTDLRSCATRTRRWHTHTPTP